MKMKLYDVVYKLSYTWEVYGVEEYFPDTGNTGAASLFLSVGDLEDFIAAKKIEFYDVINIVPIQSGIKLTVRRA